MTRRMKCIKILPVLLCILGLAGCQQAKNQKPYQEEIIFEDIMETSGTDKADETDENRSESQEDIQSDLQVENPNQDRLMEKVNQYAIPEQTFDVFLDDWGEVTFVSCRPSPDEYDDWKVASFYLVKDDQILYEFPYRLENNSSKGYIGLFDGVGAVGFRDLNGDKKDDIIIITNYITGAGPDGMVPRPDATIYLAGEHEFYVAHDMIADVAEHIAETDRTIDNIYNFLRQRE